MPSASRTRALLPVRLPADDGPHLAAGMLALITISVIMHLAFSQAYYERTSDSVKDGELGGLDETVARAGTGTYGGHWYMPYVYEYGEGRLTLAPLLNIWASFLLLYNSLVPISLCATRSSPAAPRRICAWRCGVSSQVHLGRDVQARAGAAAV